MNPIGKAHDLGQSFWLDYIRRDLLDGGELAGLIEAGEIRGITSNPTIFQQAIGNSDLYHSGMRPLAHAGWNADQIFEALSIDDIRAATDLFLPLYEGTGGRDGFVSIEVNPELANDTRLTSEEARRLWDTVNRPNLMVKIPATAEGIPAIEKAIFEGININVTLIFSLERYSEVTEAYVNGLQRRSDAREPIDHVASVASFFVSRVDTAVDAALEAIIRKEGAWAERAQSLLGKAAIANAKLAYAQFKSVFEGPRFERLAEDGARPQRPLWASTSTKNARYRDVLYVEELIGEHTVNTLPPKTLDAFRDHGVARPTLDSGLSDSRAQLQALAALNVSMDEVTNQLERDGVESFAASYRSLLSTVDERANDMVGELGSLAHRVVENLGRLDADRFGARFWRVDRALWPAGKGAEVIDRRLAWLERDLENAAGQAANLADEVAQEGLEEIGWIGDARTAPVLNEAIATQGPTRKLHYLETLDPAEIRSFSRRTPSGSTLFVAAPPTKSGIQEQAALETTWSRAQNKLGSSAGTNFVSLAEPESDLDNLARERSFRQRLQTSLDTSGALSDRSMLLAALLGGSAEDLLSGIERMKSLSAAGPEAPRNPGLYLGAILAAAADRRITLLADPGLERRAEWIADILGDRTRLRVETRLSGSSPSAIIYLRSSGKVEGTVEDLLSEEVPVIKLEVETGVEGVGSDAVLWEVASGAAAHLTDDDSYSQPQIRGAESRLAHMVQKYQKKGSFGLPKPQFTSPEIDVWGIQVPDGNSESSSLSQAILSQIEPGQKFLVGLYERRTQQLQAKMVRLRDRMLTYELEWDYGGYPSRSVEGSYLLLIGSEPDRDMEVPELEVSFGQLGRAKMLAEFEELKGAGTDGCAVYVKSPGEAGAVLLALIAELEAEAAGDSRLEDRKP